MSAILVFSDRAPEDVVPALTDLHLDIKHEPLGGDVGARGGTIGVEVAFVDAVENPGQAWATVRALRQAASGRPLPIVVVLEREHLDRFPWDEAADDVVYPGAPGAELRLRLAMLRRRIGGGGGGPVLRLGAVAIDTETFRVTAAGRPLDLTFKEFELLRFLAQHPGRVFTRPALLREVWGYDFYGGSRTVDVHVRRLRAKLGPEHEHLIQTVRSVGYRAAEPEG